MKYLQAKIRILLALLLLLAVGFVFVLKIEGFRKIRIGNLEWKYHGNNVSEVFLHGRRVVPSCNVEIMDNGRYVYGNCDAPDFTWFIYDKATDAFAVGDFRDETARKLNANDTIGDAEFMSFLSMRNSIRRD